MEAPTLIQGDRLARPGGIHKLALDYVLVWGFVGDLVGGMTKGLKAGGQQDQKCDYRKPACDPQLTCIHRW